jgi:hypothetical protein
MRNGCGNILTINKIQFLKYYPFYFGLIFEAECIIHA